MKLVETELKGVYLLKLLMHEDPRGSFKRLWEKEELQGLGLSSELDYVALSSNKQRGTFRGMHYQAAPYEEIKIVQCVRGEIYDVILDVRRDSETFGKWISVNLSPQRNCAVYISKGLAHGFQTLVDESEVLYCISAKYDVSSARGVRWTDPKFNIRLPLEVASINERDAGYPDFE